MQIRAIFLSVPRSEYDIDITAFPVETSLNVNECDDAVKRYCPIELIWWCAWIAGVLLQVDCRTILAIWIGDEMKTKQMLTLDDAQKIAAAAETEALANNWAVVISVVDDGGHLLLLHRLDGAPLMSTQIAPAKAKSAAFGKRDTKIFEDIINNGRFAFMTVPGMEGMLEGGVAIIADGQCLGAVGVSGVKSTEDVQIAKAGIAALAL